MCLASISGSGPRQVLTIIMNGASGGGSSVLPRADPSYFVFRGDACVSGAHLAPQGLAAWIFISAAIG